MTIQLKPIDRENFRPVIRLKVAPGQEEFVASNAVSIAQSKIEPECVPLAVYADETPVGFVMYAFDADEQKYWIYRLMIDGSQQGKGYGRGAMEAVIALLRTQPGCDEIGISYVRENEAAARLYERLGFETTGEIVEGEVVARLSLTPPDAPRETGASPPAITQLDHLVLTVRDIDATVEFYRRALGMEQVRFGEGRTALRFGRQKINLHAAGHEFEPKAQRPTPGSADLCLLTSAPLAAVIAHLEACGVPIEAGPVRRTGAVSPIESVYVRDPDGNLIEIARELGQ